MSRHQILNLFSWILLGAIFLYFAYAKGWIFASFDSITPQHAQKMLQNEEKVFLLDVRTQEEFTQEFIAGATLIPVQELRSKLSLLEKERGNKIIVYCHSGNRSVKASRILEENGFTPLNMSGGIMEWKNSGLPVETAQ